MTEIKITKDMIEPNATSVEPNAIDSVTVTYDGKRYRVDIVPDTDSSPFDADCYDPEDIESWRNGQWWFVGVIVTPLDVPESVQFELSDSLWGLEYNFPLNPPQGRTFRRTNTDYQVMHYPVPDMLSQVIGQVKAWYLSEAWHNHCFS